MTNRRPPHAPTPPAAGWFLFDGSCGLCSQGVVRSEGILRRARLERLPLQTEWVSAHLGLDPTRPPEEVRVLLGSGETFTGADAYRYICGQIGWLQPIAAMSRLPVARAIFDSVYRIVARHRRKISRVCGFTPLIELKLTELKETAAEKERTHPHR